MRTNSRFNDEHDLARWFIENTDFKSGVEIEVIQYGRELYFIAFGCMGNTFDKRATSFGMNTLFMTDDEIESELARSLEYLKASFIDRDFLKTDDPDQKLIDDLATWGVPEELLESVKQRFTPKEDCNFSTAQVN